MKRYKPTRQDNIATQSMYAPVPLPVNHPCAIYARQSTSRQVVDNIESAAMQTTEQLEKARRHGWTEDTITLFIENQMADGRIRSASGTLRIDQREGLSALMELVVRDVIKAIFVYNESRLFRDEWNIQVDTFIKACHDHDVRVITNTYVYDFRRNKFDRDQFRVQARIAADFITNHVKGLLHPARNRKSARGLCVAGSSPVGYIVDVDRNSPTYRKYIPYEPHAAIVRHIFRRYRELGGRLNELGRELNRLPFVFPDFADVPVPARFNAKKVSGGYGVSRSGLIGILTNTAYIGYWTFGGECLSKNNHAAIVDESDFWFAFSRLSDVSPDGEDQERIGRLPTRFSHSNTVALDALLRDVLVSSDGGKVYVDTAHRSYRAFEYSNSFEYRSFSISSASIDRAFTQRLIWRLKQEHKSGTNETPDAMNTRLREVQASRETQAVTVQGQLETATSRIAVLRRNLNLDADTNTLNGWARELKNLVENIVPVLESKIKAVEKGREEVTKFNSLYERVKHEWNGMTFEEKQSFVDMIAAKVVISEVSPHLVKIEIQWDEPYNNEVDTGYMWNARGGETKWSDEEQAVLKEMYPTADRADILNRLPTRSWNMVRNYTRGMDISRDKHNLNTSPLHPSLSVRDAELLRDTGIAFTDELIAGRCEWGTTNFNTPSTWCGLALPHPALAE